MYIWNSLFTVILSIKFLTYPQANTLGFILIILQKILLMSDVKNNALGLDA